MPITPVTRHESFLAAAAAGEIELNPVTREEVFLQNIAEAVAEGGGGVGESNSVKYTAQSLTDPQKAQARTNIAAAAGATVETISGTTATISATENTIYKCGELTALTIDTFPQTGSFSVVFTSGATATVFTEPSGMVLPDSFSVEANKRYEINVSDGYAVVASWPMEVSQ